MANIKGYLDNIKNAMFGREVRSSIHDGMDAINKEVENTTGRQVDLENTFDQLIINAGNSNAEIVDARVKEDGTSYAKLGYRLDEVDSQLDAKVNKGDSIKASQIDKNLGKFDETYMTDEFLQQMAGNTPIHTVVADKSITQEKMSTPFLPAIKGKNLFNKNTITDKKYVDFTTGNVLDSVTSNVSEFIELKPSTLYTLSGTKDQFALYDVNKNYIKGFANGNANLSFSFTTTENTVYCMLTVRDSELDLAQLEEGYIKTEYEDYHTYKFDETTIKNRLKKNKLDESLMFGIRKNLFNKETITDLKYVDYITGELLDSVTANASDYIELEPNTQYTLSGTKDQFALYDSSKAYLNGYQNSSESLIFSFVTTSNTRYCRLTIRDSELNGVQLEKGSKTDYSNYDKFFLDSNDILDFKTNNNYKVVKKYGGDFSRLTDAVSSSVDGDIIFVYPGIYENETVRAWNKNITIIGIDKNKCIIKNNNGLKANPPVEMNVGTLKNLTIINYNTPGVTQGNTSYALHIDDYSSYSRGYCELSVEDCVIVSELNSAIGIGLWPDYKLTLKDCEIKCTNNITNGALFVHNSQVAGEEQNIIIDNCKIHSLGDIAMFIHDVSGNLEGRCNVTCYNNNFFSKITKKDCIKVSDNTIEGALAGKRIFLTDDSFGNNVNMFNV